VAIGYRFRRVVQHGRRRPAPGAIRTSRLTRRSAAAGRNPGAARPGRGS